MGTSLLACSFACALAQQAMAMSDWRNRGATARMFYLGGKRSATRSSLLDRFNSESGAFLFLLLIRRRSNLINRLLRVFADFRIRIVLGEFLQDWDRTGGLETHIAK